MGHMGKWPWQCTTTGLDNSTELRIMKIREAVTEIWVPQVWQPPARPNCDNTPGGKKGVLTSSTQQRSTWVQYFRTKTLQVRIDSTENKLNPIKFIIMYNLHKIILLYINEMFKLKINNSKPKDWSRIPLTIHNQMCYYEYMIPGVRQNLSVPNF